MTDALIARSGNTCELCGADEDLAAYAVGPDSKGDVFLCQTCRTQIDEMSEPNHWRALSSSMWSEHAPVQVMAWRILDRLQDHDWARDLAEMLYLDEETLAWAKSGAASLDIVHKDSNGVGLSAGDTVVLVKDLPVKGGGFTAKRGTAVRGISLVADNPAHIEGRVEGQRIVILTEFVKKR